MCDENKIHQLERQVYERDTTIAALQDEVERLRGEVELRTRERDMYDEQCSELRAELAERNAQLFERQLSAQQVKVPEWKQVMQKLVSHIDRNTCMHEETHRGGAIWEICDQCGARWADDKGGKPEYTEPEYVAQARTMLAAPAEGSGK